MAFQLKTPLKPVVRKSLIDLFAKEKAEIWYQSALAHGDIDTLLDIAYAGHKGYHHYTDEELLKKAVKQMNEGTLRVLLQNVC